MKDRCWRQRSSQLGQMQQLTAVPSPDKRYNRATRQHIGEVQRSALRSYPARVSTLKETVVPFDECFDGRARRMHVPQVAFSFSGGVFHATADVTRCFRLVGTSEWCPIEGSCSDSFAARAAEEPISTSRPFAAFVAVGLVHEFGARSVQVSVVTPTPSRQAASTKKLSIILRFSSRAATCWRWL